MGEKIKFPNFGDSLDTVIINANTPLISVSKPENILTTLVYSGQPSDLLGTLVNDQWLIKKRKTYKS